MRRRHACLRLLLAAETGGHLWQARAGATAAPCSSWPGERDMWVGGCSGWETGDMRVGGCSGWETGDMRAAGCKCGYRDMAHAAECAGVATGAVMPCAVCLRLGGQGPHLSERAGCTWGAKHWPYRFPLLSSPAVCLLAMLVACDCMLSLRHVACDLPGSSGERVAARAPGIDVQHGPSLSSACWRGLVEQAMCEALLVATRPWLQGCDRERRCVLSA